MNKLIKIAVWAFLFTIVVSGIGIIKNAYGDEYQTLSHEYNLVYANQLIVKIHKLPKNTPIVIYFKDETSVFGLYKGYCDYDDSLWVKEDGHWLQSGYTINAVQDVVVSVKEKV